MGKYFLLMDRPVKKISIREIKVEPSPMGRGFIRMSICPETDEDCFLSSFSGDSVHIFESSNVLGSKPLFTFCMKGVENNPSKKMIRVTSDKWCLYKNIDGWSDETLSIEKTCEKLNDILNN